MSLKKDLIKVGFSNFIVLISSLVNSFILPTILTIKGYADYKTYILYASFIGFLHFGFVDGINVKYGGIDKRNLNIKEFEDYHTFFILFQIIIVGILSVLSVLINNNYLFFICLAIIPINIQSFFLFFYQAIGEFRIYSLVTIIVPLCNTFITLALLLFKVMNFEAFVFSNIASYYISMIILEIRFFREKKVKPRQSSNNIPQFLTEKIKVFISVLKNHKNIFISGFFIMLGTVLFNLFFNTGRWITKIFTDDEKFAIYSLSLSLIGFIVIFVSAVNKTFYPYLYRNNNLKVLTKLRRILYITSTIALPSYFILKYIILNYLPKYTSALLITAIVITSIPGIFIIKSIYANLYKIEKKESDFLTDTIIYLAIGFLLNISSFLYFKTLTSIAIASVITIYIWTVFPLSFKIISATQRFYELCYIVVVIGSFFTIYWFDLHFIYSSLLSFIFIIGINFVFFREQSLSLLKRSL